mmetsp:Transcript_33397/g.99435  ORF Transcript_33397/g.99435 Transcript_33397/m.99435 type:complete len:448 (+) Transcript_33397:575-1918(+)
MFTRLEDPQCQLDRLRIVNLGPLHAQPPRVLENLHPPVIIHSEEYVQSPHLRLGRAMRCALSSHETELRPRGIGRIVELRPVKVDEIGAHHLVREAPVEEPQLGAVEVVVQRRLLGGPSPGVVVVLIQSLHGLSQFLHVLLTLLQDEMRYVTELMLAHGVPTGDALVAPHGDGVALAARPNVILKDEIFSDHPGAVPDELVDVEGRGWGGIVARIGPLPVSFHDPFLEVSAHPLQHPRGAHQLGYVQLEIGRRPSESLDGRLPHRPVTGVQPPRIDRLQKLNVVLHLPAYQLLVGAHVGAFPHEGPPAPRADSIVVPAVVVVGQVAPHPGLVGIVGHVGRVVPGGGGRAACGDLGRHLIGPLPEVGGEYGFGGRRPRRGASPAGGLGREALGVALGEGRPAVVVVSANGTAGVAALAGGSGGGRHPRGSRSRGGGGGGGGGGGPPPR